MWLFVLEASLAPVIYKINYIVMLNQKKKVYVRRLSLVECEVKYVECLEVFGYLIFT